MKRSKSTHSGVEATILAIDGVKPRRDGEPDDKYRKRLARTVAEISETNPRVWSELSSDVQRWVNDAVSAINNDEPAPEFPEAEPEEADEAEVETEESEEDSDEDSDEAEQDDDEGDDEATTSEPEDSDEAEEDEDDEEENKPVRLVKPKRGRPAKAKKAVTNIKKAAVKQPSKSSAATRKRAKAGATRAFIRALAKRPKATRDQILAKVRSQGHEMGDNTATSVYYHCALLLEALGKI